MSAVAVVAAGASACSSMPSWTDPTNWIGGDDNQTASAPDAQTADAQTNTADNAQTPDLSQVPDKPDAASNADEQKQVAESLSADRSKAQYSGDALRGGTEPAAAPPPAEAPQPATDDLSASDSGAQEQAAPPPAPPPPAPVTSAPGTLPAEAPALAADETAPAPSAAPAPAAGAAPGQLPSEAAAQPSQAPMQVASLPAPSGPPAVPAVPATMPLPHSDASLGFKASSAPPLDPTVAQFVPKSIMSRYAQTAAIGAAPAVPSAAYSDAIAEAGLSSHRHRRTHAAEMGVGGPEHMSGAVVADFDALQAGSAGDAAAMPGGPAAVVFFPHDTTVLSEAAKARVRSAARAFLAQGGQGFVKVVGYASGRGQISAERQIVWNFERSQARATAVARALIAEGVPAEKVLIEAAGNAGAADGSVPQGEESSRRADIFFQS